MSPILAALLERVLLCDGGMGTQLQGKGLTLADYEGLENCTEILVRSRPEVVRSIHAAYFEAGADMVETNSFGGTPLTLGEFGLASEAFDLNRRAAIVAREAADGFSDGRARYVLGSIGPGTKLPSLGHVDYDTLESGYAIQGEGLISGGIDAFLIETCQDPLQFKAAINGLKLAIAKTASLAPIFLQVTVETTGTMLVGADIAAAATVAQSLGVASMGLNCATGPQEMAQHVKWLAENWPGLISVQPNAGLPELVDGAARYPLSPEELASWQERFLLEDGVNLLGGCCGTTPAHIQAIDAMLRKNGQLRPAPRKRSVHWIPAVASLYGQVPLRQENAFLAIGERCNANGSKKFREMQEAENWDGVVQLAREQVKEGSHTLDLCTAFVGRDEKADMLAAVSRLRGEVTAPLVIDSTDTKVIEAALKLYGGKAIINSINFENGEAEARERIELAVKYGASVVALTIDEVGMAKDVETKLKITRRLRDFAVKHGLAASELLIDPLTFTVCTGNDDDRRLAIETLEAMRRIREEMPELNIVLGLSNISFGLKPAARQVLNSVFLDLAVKAGMSAAIVHVSKLLPLHKLAANEIKVAEDLLLDRRAEGYDPLTAFIALFVDRQAEEAKAARAAPTNVEERLQLRIVDGNRQGLDIDLEEALKTHAPLAIVNEILLSGMKIVGELFGSGKMQLPFVLQSAETMKAAVAYLEPKMEKKDGGAKGTIVLATVQGDVHDIGKNLVDIILSNNGYQVFNIGIKQPISAIIEALKKHKPDVLGLSGLLVKSTVIMRENLEELGRQGFDLPVLLGGAALTRNYVEADCVAAYPAGRVAYAGDAFDGLDLMAKVVGKGFDTYLTDRQTAKAKRPAKKAKPAYAEASPESVRSLKAQLAADHVIPTPPFWGASVVEDVPLKALLPYLNRRTLYQFQWGYTKEGKTLAEWESWAEKELTPILNAVFKLCEKDAILTPKACYGYFKAKAKGDRVTLFDESGTRELTSFTFPRQSGEGGLCLSDYISEEEMDVVALQVVTMGKRATEVANHWKEANRYQDYLHLHGLGVEMAEAMAEYMHKRIRAELGFAAEEARDIERLLKQEYRGARYSFGYPACPNLADQKQLLALLGAERIGVSLTEGDQLEPEQSTSALVLHHPKATYFKI